MKDGRKVRYEVEGLRYIGEAGSFQPDEAYFACADRCWLAA